MLKKARQRERLARVSEFWRTWKDKLQEKRCQSILLHWERRKLAGFFKSKISIFVAHSFTAHAPSLATACYSAAPGKVGREDVPSTFCRGTHTFVDCIILPILNSMP